MARRLTQVSFLAFVLPIALGSAFAQRLAPVLPEETVFALGTEGLADHAGKLDAFIAEAERLELGDALTALFGDAEEGEEFGDDLPAGFDELAPLDLLGQEAWFAVSISSFNPLPALTLIARTSGDATSQVAEGIRQSAEEEGAETASEGSVTIYLYPVDGEDTPFPVMAISQADDVVVASTNPDVLRSVLRRMAGSGEAGFSSSAGYGSTLGQLDGGNIYAFLDYTRLAAALEPLGSASGFELLVARALGGLGTVGTSGSVFRVDDDGVTSESIRIPGAGDPALAALLTASAPASREPLRFTPAEALSVSVSHFDLPGWWDYLVDLAGSSDELGNPDLDELAMQFTGIDLRASLFDWMGSQVASITTGVTAPVEPGVPSENLLGEAVYLVQSSDDAAAGQGLSMLFGTVGGLVAGFADPTGQGGAAGIAQRDVAGVQVTSYRMGPGVNLAHAVTDGWALIATSDDAIDQALAARDQGGALRGELARLAGEVPDSATAYSLTDLAETLSQSGAQTASQMQMFAGLAGGNLDFDALQQAGETLEEFVSFVAERAGGSVSYTVTDATGTTRSYGRSEFNW
ncbi:MAG: DUF3352 domain-containing protein [Trueperaceae bacterium]